MSAPRFDWDPAKARENLHKHGVSFEEAQTVFDNEQALLLDYPDHSTGEQRFGLLGLRAPLRLLLVVQRYREDDAVIRLIAARKATRSERAQHGARWLR